MRSVFILFLVISVTISCSSSKKAEKDGVTLKTFTNAVPNRKGILETVDLHLEPFEEVVMFASQWWPGGGNRLYPRYSKNGDLAKGMTGGVLLVVKHSVGNYSCFLTGANNDLFSWISTENGKKFQLNTGNLGKGSYSGKNKILYTKSTGTNIYQTINKAWELHLTSAYNTSTVKERESKEYPQYFNYLGWCSWEGFNRSISEKNLKEAVTSFEKGDVPIRYMLMDAGHMQNHKGDPFQYNALERLKPFPDKFPTNYKSLLDMRKEDKVRWMGVWLSFLGGRDGIYPINDMPEDIKSVLKMTHMNTLVPEGGAMAAKTFYNKIISSYVSEPGWDFTKIDFQSRALTHYAGGEESNHPVKNNKGAFPNAYEAVTNLTLALEKTLGEKNLGLINCNSLNTFSIFNNFNSVVARCSEDYKLYDLGRAKSHLYHSYATMPLLGKVLWGDYDMFHSSDTISGKMMAISKAMSGGPIYLSDKPNHFEKANIDPLCYSNGKLLRPLAPAIPTEESFFIDAQCEPSVYMAFAPLKNESVALVAYNLYTNITLDESIFKRLIEHNIPKEIIDIIRKTKVSHIKDNDTLIDFLSDLFMGSNATKKYRNIIYKLLSKWGEETSVKGVLKSTIYENAGSMIQPYQGKWKLPKEGVLCYDWYSKSAIELKDSFNLELDGFGDKFYHLVPIKNGWSIIGDASKYLSPVSYDVKFRSENEIDLEFEEAGTLVFYNKAKKVISSVGEPKSIGKYLWELSLPYGTKGIKLSI